MCQGQRKNANKPIMDKYLVDSIGTEEMLRIFIFLFDFHTIVFENDVYKCIGLLVKCQEKKYFDLRSQSNFGAKISQILSLCINISNIFFCSNILIQGQTYRFSAKTIILF